MSKGKLEKSLSKLADMLGLSVPMTYNNDPQKIEDAGFSWVEGTYFFIGQGYCLLTTRDNDDCYVMSSTCMNYLDKHVQDIKKAGTTWLDGYDLVIDKKPSEYNALMLECKLIKEPLIRFIYKERWHVITATEAKQHGIVIDDFVTAAFDFCGEPYNDLGMTKVGVTGTYDFFLHVKLTNDKKM